MILVGTLDRSIRLIHQVLRTTEQLLRWARYATCWKLQTLRVSPTPSLHTRPWQPFGESCGLRVPKLLLRCILTLSAVRDAEPTSGPHVGQPIRPLSILPGHVNGSDEMLEELLGTEDQPPFRSTFGPPSWVSCWSSASLNFVTFVNSKDWSTSDSLGVEEELLTSLQQFTLCCCRFVLLTWCTKTPLTMFSHSMTPNVRKPKKTIPDRLRHQTRKLLVGAVQQVVGYAQLASARPFPHRSLPYCQSAACASQVAADRGARAEEQGVCQLWPPLHTSTQQSANPFDTSLTGTHGVVTTDQHEMSEHKSTDFLPCTCKLCSGFGCLPASTPPM